MTTDGGATEDKPVTKKKMTPGGGEIVNEIRQVNSKIADINNKKAEYEEKIRQIMSSKREGSKIDEMIEKVKELNELIRDLIKKKNEYHLLMGAVNSRIKKIKDQTVKEKSKMKMSNINTEEDIGKRLERLNMELITKSVGPKREKEIINEMNALNACKEIMDSVLSSKEEIETTECTATEYREKIGILRKAMDSKKKERDALQADIDKISGELKTKTPEVLELEGKIKALLIEKEGFVKKRAEHSRRLKDLEDKYTEFETKLNEQKDIQGMRKKIESEIEKLNERRELLEKDLELFDPRIFDSMVLELEKLRGQRNITLSTGLVGHLLKHRIHIPSSEEGTEGIERSIQELEERRRGWNEDFSRRKNETEKTISQLNLDVLKEREKLREMPIPDQSYFERDAFKKQLKN
jgi:uncharacterized coiled-coil DUF342 family protein